MQRATSTSVLGNFNDTKFTHSGVTSTFFKQGESFMVRTDAADGTLKDFKVEYTFGVYPLQQYLIETNPGQLQALSIFWDARAAAEGGQRWEHLYPAEKIPAEDPLHWTGRLQNWNTMCAACHSTDLRKNYDATTNRFARTWKDINVACEACHGPASNHLRWAQALSGTSQGRAPPSTATSQMQANAPNATSQARTATRALPNSGFTTHLSHEDSGAQAWHFASRDDRIATFTGATRSPDRMEVCFPCHSRRSQLTEPAAQGATNFLDGYMPAVLDEGLYQADGQILDEVYEYGSFQQSRMHQRGVICSDCHNPHSLKLRHEGNGVCAQCHSPAAFDTPAHHHHPANKAAPLCADCHMPQRRYMVVDMRRDHSIRVPRPDLSLTHGTPNACDQCHANKGLKWQADAVARWFGKPSRPLPPLLATTNKDAKAAARSIREGATDTTLPAIVRATFASRLEGQTGDNARTALESALHDDNALVRATAAKSLAAWPAEIRVAPLTPLLEDQVRAVRIEAARALADVPESALSTQQQTARHTAERELIAAELANAERPEAHHNLAAHYMRQGDATKAESSLRTALRLDPWFIPAYVNLADVLRASDRDADAESLLTEARRRSPKSAAVAHSLGLLKVRTGDMKSALELLGAATRLAPEDARFGYVYAIGLQSAGRSTPALRELERVRRQAPADEAVLFALASIHRDLGHRAEALRWVQELLSINPQHADGQALRLSLR